VVFEFDVTPKATGQRVKNREIAVYTVANGLIVREEFFYGEGANALAR
jgi:ketosteroid isomerase-like protein